MNILIDVGHPAHIHLFRNAADEWIRRGHQVLFTVRDKDIAVDLLEIYGYRYFIVSRPKQSIIGLLFEFFERGWHVLKLTRKHNCDLLLGTSVSIGPVSKITRAKSIFFGEDDAAVVRLQATLAHPLADTIVTPACLADDFGAKHIVYDSYQELAYLHPHRFSPNPRVLADLGISEDEKFFIVRLVALRAIHDSKQIGLSKQMCRKLISKLSEFGRVFISSEDELPEEFSQYQISISPTDIHHAMSYATMLISDSQTMTAEAAVLGTPAIRCNTFVGKISYLEELEHRYGLTFGFQPDDEEKMFDMIMHLLKCPSLGDDWQKRRKLMLQDKLDLTEWMVDFVEKYEIDVLPIQQQQSRRWTWRGS